MSLFLELDTPPQKKPSEDYDFRGESYKSFFPNLHRYPATMLPQIGMKLMREFDVKGRVALDPFCGSGSSFIALISAGFKEIHGCDRNDFAVLLSRTRYQKYDFAALKRDVDKIKSRLDESVCDDLGSTWFPPGVWATAQKIRDQIKTIAAAPQQNFLMLALCEALRKASYTRQDEFKLYRIPVADRDWFRPNLAANFAQSVTEKLHIQQQNAVKLNGHDYNLLIHNQELSPGMAKGALDGRVECILSSPPYGDSHTTVAYGQFSYFANLLLEVENTRSLDNALLGGKKAAELYSKFSIGETISAIAALDRVRALEVSAFYRDAEIMVHHLAASLAPSGWVFFVVGNRRVKSKLLASDVFFAEAFAAQGLTHITSLGRKISNKVMPAVNSPSNAIGLTLPTMSNEHIVVMRRGR